MKKIKLLVVTIAMVMVSTVAFGQSESEDGKHNKYWAEIDVCVPTFSDDNLTVSVYWYGNNYPVRNSVHASGIKGCDTYVVPGGYYSLCPPYMRIVATTRDFHTGAIYVATWSGETVTFPPTITASQFQMEAVEDPGIPPEL